MLVSSLFFDSIYITVLLSYFVHTFAGFFNSLLGKDMSDIDKKQLVLYAQMSNLVNLILQWPDNNIKEIAENFSKVSWTLSYQCL